MAHRKPPKSNSVPNMRNVNVLSYGIYTNNHQMTNYFHAIKDTFFFATV